MSITFKIDGVNFEVDRLSGEAFTLHMDEPVIGDKEAFINKMMEAFDQIEKDESEELTSEERRELALEEAGLDRYKGYV